MYIIYIHIRHIHNNSYKAARIVTKVHKLQIHTHTHTHTHTHAHGNILKPPKYVVIIITISQQVNVVIRINIYISF